MQKFKIGQQVKIKRDLIANNRYPHYNKGGDTITPNMKTLGGMVATIVDEDVNRGYFLDDEEDWAWPSSALISTQPLQTKRRSYV